MPSVLCVRNHIHLGREHSSVVQGPRKASLQITSKTLLPEGSPAPSQWSELEELLLCTRTLDLGGLSHSRCWAGGL